MMARLNKTWIGKQVRGSLLKDELFWNNEIKANRVTAWTMLCAAAVLGFCWLLDAVGVFTVDKATMSGVCAWGIVELLAPVGVCAYFKGEKRWLKLLMVLEFVVVLARIDSVLTWSVQLIMLIPVVLSCRYYSRAFTALVAAFTTFCFLLSTLCGSALHMGLADQNILAEGGNYVLNTFLFGFLPKWLVFALVAGVCVQIAQRGHDLVVIQVDSARERTRLEAEMDMAAKIQLHALPDVHKLRTTMHGNFELAASMVPAREVGGDFYNFFYTDPTHLALMIADVSGKGVPAALFMMVSKMMLDGTAKTGRSPGAVLAAVNHLLCEDQMENMFVTVWLGVLDLTTGELVSANGGHEYPIVCKNGRFDVFKDKHGLVLGGMDPVKYRETTMHLDEGDTLFVYTDGVPEANDEHEQLFGMERMLESLNRHKDEPVEQLIRSIKQDVDAYAGSMPQFDDTTMLALRLTHYLTREGVRMPADASAPDKVRDYLTQQLQSTALAPDRAALFIQSACSAMERMSAETSASWAEAILTQNSTALTLVLHCNGLRCDPVSPSEASAALAAGFTRVDAKYEDGQNEVILEMGV